MTVTQSAVDNPDEPDDPDAKIAELGILYFYGDYFGIGAGNYLLYLVTGEYEIDGGEIYVINGSVITLDMIADEVTKEEVRADGAELPIGTYTCSSNYERMSFIKASYDEEYDYYEGSIIENYANGEYTDLYAIVGGTVDVQKSGDVYKITMNFEYEDGTTETVVFNDEMSSAMNYSSNSTYKEDITITGLSEGDLTFYSYMYDPNCYTWDVRMSTPGLIDANDEYGTGTEILLTLQSPTTSTTVLDNGTYTFDYSYGRFTAVPGSVFWVFPVDSWVFEYENGDWVNYSPIVSGLVTVTATDAANGVYSITLDGEGDNYYEIKTTYSGALTYIDYSGDSETGAVQNRFAKKNETDPRYVLKQKKSGGIFRGR